MVAVMDTQATQTNQPVACSFSYRPGTETEGRPFGGIIGDQRIALGTRQHAMLQKIQHPRIGMQNSQAIGIRRSDRRKLQSVGIQRMGRQQGSLPSLAAGL